MQLKNEKNALNSSKYFIPCYDIIKNEIYFTEFFTEKIISKPKKESDDENLSIKQIEENTSRKKVIISSKLTEQEEKISEQKKRQEELYFMEFTLRFKKMQIISGFNTNHYISEEYKNYFSRPIFSHFFQPQNLDLYSSNDKRILNNSSSSYSFIDVSIQFHLDSLLNLNLENYFKEINQKNTQQEKEVNNIDNLSDDDDPNQYYLQLNNDISNYTLNKRVSLLYVADSLIKDSVKYFEDVLNTLIYKCEESMENIDEVEIKEMLDDTNIANEEYEKKLIDLLKEFKTVKKNKNKSFVLKLIGYEEYLYGDNILGNYSFIMNKIRQKEDVKLILKSISKYKIHPPNFNFPPILKINKPLKEITYEELLTEYKKLYPNNDIIYRLYKTSTRQKNRCLKKSMQRKKYLTKYTESGDCDFPLKININSISNVHSFKKWFNSEHYCNSQLILPYFNPIKKFNVSNKNKIGKFFQKIQKTIFSKKGENNQDKKDKEQDPDEIFKDKLIEKYEDVKKDNKELEQKLNYLKMNSNYLSENYSSFISNLFSGGKENILNIILEKMQNKNQIDSSNQHQAESNKISISLENNIINNDDNDEYNISPHRFKSFILDNPPEELITPIFIRIKIYLLYGSYCLHKFQTQPYLLKDLIQMNESIIFQDKDNHCLISHLPFETRIGIRIKAYDQKLSKGYILGSCQIPLYNDLGEMQKGKIDFFLWPNVKINSRAVSQSQFSRIFFSKEKIEEIKNKIEQKKKRIISERDIEHLKIQNNIRTDEDNYRNQRIPSMSHEFKNQGNYNIIPLDDLGGNSKRNFQKELDYQINRLKYDTDIIELIYNNMNKYAQDFWEMTKIQKLEELLNPEKEKIKGTYEIKDDNDNNNIDDLDDKHIPRLKTFYDDIKLDYLNDNKIQEFDTHKNEYPFITIEFPKFSAPLIHSITSEKSFRQYLDIKYKYENVNNNNDYDEIRKLFGNSQKDIKEMLYNFENNLFYKNNKDSDSDKNINSKKYANNYNNNQKDKYPSDLRNYLKKASSNIIKILKKDPLEKLEQEDIISILLCRDYISTIPSALELFLRAIDWRNPLEVSLAYTYLKKWAKIDFYDAVSLLDGRFPDTRVRKYAVDRLNDFSDSIIEICLPMLCQCLFYENFLINPLADFLIERSLKNQRLIGYLFIYYNRVNRKNPLFEQRLSAYSLMFLMNVGNKFINELYNDIKINYCLETTFGFYSQQTKEKKKNSEDLNLLEKYINNNYIRNKKFNIILDPAFKATKINKICSQFIEFNTRESDIEDIYNRIQLKKLNDSRQENFIVQILKIIDNLWLKNNLDLKLVTYKVIPLELNMAFIEYIYSTDFYNISKSPGMGGTSDREIIIKHLRITNSEDLSSSYELTFNEKTDHFIKSLAAYCVITCVLGVANRINKNLLIKYNGIFLHIDFDRILGNFKRTLGIKTERTKFLLTPEMANVYIFQQKEVEFKKMCVKAFNILRHNASRLINLFIIMSSCGMTGFVGIKDIEYMKEMLVLDTSNDEDAGNYFIEEIRKCKNERLRQLDFFLQNLKL